MLSIADLMGAMECPEVRANKWISHINATLEKFNINSIPRITAFLAQIGHESGKLIYTKELWGPTPAQQRYEGRIDLGNIKTGDGFKFRGRGLIQITGRKNYQICGKQLGIDLEAYPELLETPEYAAQSAGLFWETHGCNELADKNDFRGITKIINGGYNGLDDRIKIYEHAKTILLGDV